MPYVLHATFIHVNDLSECIKVSMMVALQFVREHGTEHGVVPQHVRKIRALLVCVLTFCPGAADACHWFIPILLLLLEWEQ